MNMTNENDSQSTLQIEINCSTNWAIPTMLTTWRENKQPWDLLLETTHFQIPLVPKANWRIVVSMSNPLSYLQGNLQWRQAQEKIKGVQDKFYRFRLKIHSKTWVMTEQTLRQFLLKADEIIIVWLTSLTINTNIKIMKWEFQQKKCLLKSTSNEKMFKNSLWSTNESLSTTWDQQTLSPDQAEQIK